MYKITDIIQSDSVDLEFSNNKVHPKRFSNPNNFSKSVLFLLLPVENKEIKPSKGNSSNIHRRKSYNIYNSSYSYPLLVNIDLLQVTMNVLASLISFVLLSSIELVCCSTIQESFQSLESLQADSRGNN